ncbi:DMT family transporter [Pseudonocardia sp.]|uniref:DMT family transporter n=1 Tax=Pseudonocardia sp. TaxID=60912 RepID=UPI003D0EB801
MTPVLLASALLIGGLLTVQAAANVQLTRAVGTPYGASTLQLWLAAALLGLLGLAGGGLGALTGVLDVPAWWLLGGLASPLYITAGILLVPRLGALAAGGLFVTGQVLASAALDLTGAIGVPQRPLGIGIAAGTVAALAGIGLVVRGGAPVRGGGSASGGAPTTLPAAGGSRAAALPARGARATTTTGHPHAAGRGARRLGTYGWPLLGLAAGAALPVQGAVNARLRTALDDPFAVGLTSFTVAALAISAVLAVLLAVGATPAPTVPSSTMPWWGWLGAACAAAYVTGTFLLIPAVGAAVTVALTVTGQQVASAAVDARGWLRLPRRPLGARRAAGLALLVAGSAAVQLL